LVIPTKSVCRSAIYRPLADDVYNIYTFQGREGEAVVISGWEMEEGRGRYLDILPWKLISYALSMVVRFMARGMEAVTKIPPCVWMRDGMDKLVPH
jgi:hypothetical protein